MTGTIAAMYRARLRRYDKVYEIFLAICDESLARNPQAESLLNRFDVQKPPDVLPYIDKGDFIFTRRFLKILLKADIDDLRQVVPRLPLALREQIARGIIDTGSDLKQLFPEHCQLLILQVQ